MTSLKYPITSTVPSVIKRRRKTGGQPGQGESSREASAESNDETATDNDDPMAGDDTDTASLASSRKPEVVMLQQIRESFEETRLREASSSSASNLPHGVGKTDPEEKGQGGVGAEPQLNKGLFEGSGGGVGVSGHAVITGGGGNDNGGEPGLLSGTSKMKRPQTLIATATANSSMSTLENDQHRKKSLAPSGHHEDNKANGPRAFGGGGGMDSGMEESGLSTYDGDVSSAPGGGTAGSAMRKVKLLQHQQQQQHHPHLNHHQHYHLLHQNSDGSMSGQSRQGSEQQLRSSRLSKMSLATDLADDEHSTVAADCSIMSPTSTQGEGESAEIGGRGVATTTTTTTSNRDSSHLTVSDHPPPAPHGFLARMQAEELQARMREAIEDKAGQRSYKINAPPLGRAVRIYADGVYDLFHYGHALQLRQCKLFFPAVHLLVGVCSDELVLKHKASPVLKSAERYESVRNCKWVDEVVEDAPWQVDQDFLDKHRIDYVAHDEEPYVSLDSSDVYAYVKSKGQFLPTRRTDGVSTSELLQRIVEGYTHGVYDGKLDKIGARSLAWSEVSLEASRTRPHTPAGASN